MNRNTMAADELARDIDVALGETQRQYHALLERALQHCIAAGFTPARLLYPHESAPGYPEHGASHVIVVDADRRELAKVWIRFPPLTREDTKISFHWWLAPEVERATVGPAGVEPASTG